jgi:zinc resistance-associated protein
MKKKIAVIALVLSVGLVGFASARGGMGYGMGYNHPQMMGYAYQQPDAETQAKLNTFYTETQELRKQILVKQSERQALIRGANPDPAMAAKVSGELFDLMTTMQNKVKAAGLENYVGGPGSGRGMMGGGRGMMYGCRMM